MSFPVLQDGSEGDKLRALVLWKPLLLVMFLAPGNSDIYINAMHSVIVSVFSSAQRFSIIIYQLQRSGANFL